MKCQLQIISKQTIAYFIFFYVKNSAVKVNNTLTRSEVSWSVLQKCKQVWVSKLISAKKEK